MAWDQELEECVFVENVPDSHLILYTCTDVGEDQVDQRARILVEESKIQKNDEDFKVFNDAAKKAITDLQEKFIGENNLEFTPYNIEENLSRVNQVDECKFVEYV